MVKNKKIKRIKGTTGKTKGKIKEVSQMKGKKHTYSPCSQKRCGYYQLGGCQKCQECGAEPKIVDENCKTCFDCEYKEGSCRWGDDVKKNDVVDKISADLQKDFGKEKVNTLDGARVDFKDGMLIVRVSQNGPYLTVKFEAKDQKTYQERKDYIKKILKKYPAIDWNVGVNLEVIK